jgi:hypothetical protein
MIITRTVIKVLLDIYSVSISSDVYTVTTITAV